MKNSAQCKRRPLKVQKPSRQKRVNQWWWYCSQGLQWNAILNSWTKLWRKNWIWTSFLGSSKTRCAFYIRFSEMFFVPVGPRKTVPRPRYWTFHVWDVQYHPRLARVFANNQLGVCRGIRTPWQSWAVVLQAWLADSHSYVALMIIDKTGYRLAYALSWIYPPRTKWC